jgi:hypothetical protein
MIDYDSLSIGGEWVPPSSADRIGRELGPEALAAYQQVKSIFV